VLALGAHPPEMIGVDWVVLPGSKNTTGDLAWLRAQGLDQAILAHAAAGGMVMGLCGGLQMLGGEMVDLNGVDGAAHGLDLLPLRTRFETPKMLRQTEARFGDLTGGWSALSGIAFEGYEIHHGRTEPAPEAADGQVALRNESGEAIGWLLGNVLALYAHGLFESPAVMRALFGAAPVLWTEYSRGWRTSSTAVSSPGRS